MSGTRKLKLRLDQNGFGKVELDGVEIMECTSVSLLARAGELTEVTLQVTCPIDVELDVSAEKLTVDAAKA